MRKQPLTYAVYRLCADRDELCTNDVLELLGQDYGDHRMFTASGIEEILMTGAANGLLDEVRYDLDGAGCLRNYYRMNEYGRDTVKNFIG